MLTAKKKSYLGSLKEWKMFTVLKWIVGAFIAGFLWLVAGYTDEYLRPYKKIKASARKK
jgi:hypothetical protein